MDRLSGFGIGIDLPQGWDGRIWLRQGEHGQPDARATLHAASFPLPLDRGDFGSGAVEAMGPADVLLTLLEYEPGCTAKPLFAREGIPSPLDADGFSPTALQRSIRGQAGAQAFFCASARAFCLYVVLGSYGRRAALAAVANQALATLTIDA